MEKRKASHPQKPHATSLRVVSPHLVEPHVSNTVMLHTRVNGPLVELLELFADRVLSRTEYSPTECYSDRVDTS